MSLLMQALKKAEQAKQQQGSLPSDDTQHVEDAFKSTAQADAPAQKDGIAATPIALEAMPADVGHDKDYPTLITDPASIDRPTASFDSAAGGLSATEPALTMQELSLEPSPAENIVQSEPPAIAVTAAIPGTISGAGIDVAQARSSIAAPSAEAVAQKAREQDAKMVLAAQKKAKSVFIAKQQSRNRLALTVGAIIVILLIVTCGFGYFYLQKANQNSTILVNAAMPQSVPATGVPTAVAPAPASIVVAPPIVPSAIAAATQEKPAVTSASLAKEIDNLPPKTVSGETRIAGGETDAPARAATGVSAAATMAESQTIHIRQTSSGNQVNPALTNAYQSFVAGDTGTARQQYQRVLQQEPNNRDALLGMAAIALNQKQFSQAGSFYVKLLDLDPADPDAIAGLTSMQQGDPVQGESRLKKVLAQNPQAASVWFVLGNLYAQQARWTDAQQAYFRAFGGAPNNADYAFNLAISLDRLNQIKLATEYYQRALTLTQINPGNFNKAGVQNRIRELQSAVDN